MKIEVKFAPYLQKDEYFIFNNSLYRFINVKSDYDYVAKDTAATEPSFPELNHNDLKHIIHHNCHKVLAYCLSSNHEAVLTIKNMSALVVIVEESKDKVVGDKVTENNGIEL